MAGFEGLSYNYNDQQPLLFPKGFVGVAIETDADFAVVVVDEAGNPFTLAELDDVVVLHEDLGLVDPSEVGIQAPDHRYYFISFAGGDKITVTKPCYSTFIIEDLAGLTGLVLAVMVSDINVFFAPSLNSFRFVNVDQPSFLENLEYNATNDPRIPNHHDYCQKVEQGDNRHVQFHSTFADHSVKVLDLALATVATFVPVVLASSETIEGTPFEIWGVDIPFAAIPVGYYRIRIEALNGVEIVDTIDSEGLWVRATHVGSELVEVSNFENLRGAYFANGDKFGIRVEAKAWRRQPTTTRSFFRNSNGHSTVLSAKTQRKVKFETYNLPPYMHEQMSQFFALSDIEVGGDVFVSEEGYEEVEYRDLMDLANGAAMLEAKAGYDSVTASCV